MAQSAIGIKPEATGEIEAVLDQMEKARRSYLLPAVWQGVVGGIILSVIIFLFVGEVFLTLTLCVCCCLFASFTYRRSLLSDIYKRDIMPKLVSHLGEGVHYDAEGGLKLQDFTDSRLFEQRDTEELSCEDRVYGKIGKTSFVFCEASYKYTYEDSEGDKHTKSLFRGLAFDADFNKRFRGTTLLCQSRPSHISKREYPQVKLEDIAFNKEFKVYSTDEVEARYILTPALQERFTRLVKSIQKSKAGHDIQVSFHGTRIMILIESDKDRFEAKILSKLTMKRVEEDFAILTAMSSIVEELNLNTRIWTKN